MRAILAAVLAGQFLIQPVLAEEGDWTGEGSLSAGLNTGNTETSDIGIGIKMSHETQAWRNNFEIIADYGTKNGSETKDRTFFAGQSDRILNDQLFGFGRVSHEVDEFSSFDSRSFAGGGLGWEVFEEGPADWSLEGGPGIKFDRVKAKTTGTPAVTIPAHSDEAISFIASSNFGYQFNDAVKFGNDTKLIYGGTSNQLGNKTTLTAMLSQSLSARFSFELRHNTDVQLGYEPTDTATRMSIVYAFGG